MRREDLEHLLRAAGTVLRDSEIIVVGSQSILGTYDERELPDDTVLSIEADFLPLRDPDQAKADLVDGVLGEASAFHETHGVYAQGVDLTTSVLPTGWRNRLVRYENANTNGVVGWCLEVQDLCIAKLVAHRPKDLGFVDAPINAQLVDAIDLMERLGMTECEPSRRGLVSAYLERRAPNE